VRFVFTLYLLLIFAGLVAYTIVGLTHH